MWVRRIIFNVHQVQNCGNSIFHPQWYKQQIIINPKIYCWIFEHNLGQEWNIGDEENCIKFIPSDG